MAHIARTAMPQLSYQVRLSCKYGLEFVVGVLLIFLLLSVIRSRSVSQVFYEYMYSEVWFPNLVSNHWCHPVRKAGLVLSLKILIDNNLLIKECKWPFPLIKDSESMNWMNLLAPLIRVLHQESVQNCLLFVCFLFKSFFIWTASSEFGTYSLCKQRRFRRACASAQSRQNLRCSLIQAVSQEEPSDRKPDPWPLWMAGHAQLKFVMTECSKTQIRLTRPIWLVTVENKVVIFVSGLSSHTFC